jgi:hypothetical protein
LTTLYFVGVKKNKIGVEVLAPIEEEEEMLDYEPLPV